MKKFTITPISVVNVNRPKIPKRTNKLSDNQSSRQGFSSFPMEIGTLCANFFLEHSTMVFDPFAGWGERHKCCENEGLNYTGFDISPDAIDYAKKTFNVTNTLANSLVDEIPPHDALLTCPPYGSLEKYEGEGNISKCKNYDIFLSNYKKILSRATKKALPNSTYCIMVGDWRSKGIYYNFSLDTENIMNELGFKTADKIIVNQTKTANWRVMMVNAKRFKYTAKVHQYLLVFKNHL
tara:strand:- start:11686 stop:12396 length:711 start_codon:yes stop_codon:yes gene_type:complete